MMKNVLTRTLCILLLLSLSRRMEAQTTPGDWKHAEEIVQSVVAPRFAPLNVHPDQFGAVGDGRTDCTAAFAAAIDSCVRSGGGTVIVPEGTYMTGAIRLKSNVRLLLNKGSKIVFSADPKQYLPMVMTRWEGVELMNYSPLIYAYGEKNIAVTGEGTLDGNASKENWWSWKGLKQYGWSETKPHQKKGRDALMRMAEDHVPVEQRLFGEGHYLRPSFIQFYRCENIEISGVTIKDAPMWFIHPVLSSKILIDGVTVVGHGPNNDGCNPESSDNVVIRNCTFDTGDDCIAIKSGRNADGRRLNIPSTNIVIQRCIMKDGHGGVVIGSEISGSVRNVYIEDCVMDSPNLDRALRFKTNSVRGGTIENILARNITVEEVADAVILVDYDYEEGDAGTFTPVMRGLYLKNITARKGNYGFYVKGYQRSPIMSVIAEDCRFTGISKGNIFEHTKDFQFTNVSMNGVTVPTPR